MLERSVVRCSVVHHVGAAAGVLLLLSLVATISEESRSRSCAMRHHIQTYSHTIDSSLAHALLFCDERLGIAKDTLVLLRDSSSRWSTPPAVGVHGGVPWAWEALFSPFLCDSDGLILQLHQFIGTEVVQFQCARPFMPRCGPVVDCGRLELQYVSITGLSKSSRATSLRELASVRVCACLCLGAITSKGDHRHFLATLITCSLLITFPPPSLLHLIARKPRKTMLQEMPRSSRLPTNDHVRVVVPCGVLWVLVPKSTA